MVRIAATGAGIGAVAAIGALTYVAGPFGFFLAGLLFVVAFLAARMAIRK